MKNKLNILLLISFILTLTLVIWLNYQLTHSIGDIEYDKKIDNPEFIVCNKNRIVQYYSFGAHYNGGEKAIKKELDTLINNLNFNKPGLLTYRFIINCNNKTGRFRVKMVDFNLKETHFKTSNISKIKESIKNLTDWEAAKWKDELLDSYYVLNFKIENGKITDIF